MSSKPCVSVIVPCANNNYALLKVVNAICQQTTKPHEIIIINSYANGQICSLECLKVCIENQINLKYEYRDRAFPGDARNIGLSMASGDYIAFVDVETIPHTNWLKISLDLIEGSFVDGVLGATYFAAITSFEKILRDGLFGRLPRNTLPGAVFKRNVFIKTGQFIEWVRAGEDTEWLLRLKILKVPITYSSSPLLEYKGILNMTLIKILKKWFRNYLASRELPHFSPQKLLIRLLLYPLLVLVAFNWNYLIADWQMESLFYISHITKITVVLPPLIYLFTRGLILPLCRGINIWSLLPIRFLMIIYICILADLVKIIVFTLPVKVLNAISSKIN